METSPRKPAKRRCKGTNKAGKPCGAVPQKGKDWCRAHDPDLSGKDRFGSPEQAATANPAGRPRIPKVIELLSQRAEAEADRIVGTLLEQLDAERGVVVGNGPDAYVDSVPDAPARLRAVAEILDRVAGKPRQTTELSGPEGGPVALVAADAGNPKVRQLLGDALRADRDPHGD
jgi:hypothetical protein